MKEIIKYKLLKDLPLYPAGTIVIHEFDILPSQYLDKKGNSQTYATEGQWYVEEYNNKIMASAFLYHLVKWCVSSQRTDDNHEEWIQKV